MMIKQTCPCGGSIVVTGSHNASRSERDHQTAEARKQLDVWRRAHRACLKPHLPTLAEMRRRAVEPAA